MEERPKVVRKAVLLGNTGVGKTTLFIRYTEDEFQQTHVPTLGGATRCIDFTQDGVTSSVYLWDTAGQEQYRATTSIYMRNVKAVMVVFDVTDQSSFDDIETWLKEFNTNDTEFIIVGNKVDMTDRRVVSEVAGREYANSVGGLYYEASAKNGDGVHEAFNQLLSMAAKPAPDDGDQAIYIEHTKRSSGCSC